MELGIVPYIVTVLLSLISSWYWPDCNLSKIPLQFVERQTNDKPELCGVRRHDHVK